MKIGEFITGVAMVAFLLALCSIESMSMCSIITLIISGSWIVTYGVVLMDEKQTGEGR